MVRRPINDSSKVPGVSPPVTSAGKGRSAVPLLARRSAPRLPVCAGAAEERAGAELDCARQQPQGCHLLSPQARGVLGSMAA